MNPLAFPLRPVSYKKHAANATGALRPNRQLVALSTILRAAPDLATMSGTRQTRDRRASLSPTRPPGLASRDFDGASQGAGPTLEEPNIVHNQSRAPRSRSSSHRHRRAIPEREDQPA